ncbi:DUF6301 family protein [Buchananella hordeovulneris]|uniref:DUF6301 family protein n=1 Tax=Buchananella hordeovulneris TaxID=52770 RepID=UPI0026DA8FDF|nr:DUF6301 family protein [Buchananella hordeovulneris]MDO5079954.1 DUF6301 family protein [Buchananella hordeovulneris]
MSDFRILGPDRCLELILAWAEADWPMSREQAQFIALGLGWLTIAGMSRHFCSELSSGEPDCNLGELRWNISGIDFPLSKRASGEEIAKAEAAILSLATELERRVTERYGEPQRSELEEDGIRSYRWTLCSGLSFDVFYTHKMIHVTITSPARNKLLTTARAYLEENGESEEL